jgi:peptide chain release factor 1
MLDIIEKYEIRLDEINRQLVDQAVLGDQEQLKLISRERSRVEEILQVGRAYKKYLKSIEDAKGILKESNDPELIQMAKDEIEETIPRLEETEKMLSDLLAPKDPNDARNAIVEIRAGTGGEEAAIFAADLYRMYVRFAERKGWKTELLSSNPTGVGGLKEAIFLVSGNSVFGEMKFESGVHRVQRVPQTESQGRIHTSAASVAVLLEAEDVDVKIKENELKIDVYRSSGP